MNKEQKFPITYTGAIMEISRAVCLQQDTLLTVDPAINADEVTGTIEDIHKSLLHVITLSFVSHPSKSKDYMSSSLHQIYTT